MPVRGVLPAQSSEEGPHPNPSANQHKAASHAWVPSRTVFADDYEERLPEDEYCQETATNARVWRVYVEEAETFDRTMDRQYRDGLDVMLVFASISNNLHIAHLMCGA